MQATRGLYRIVGEEVTCVLRCRVYTSVVITLAVEVCSGHLPRVFILVRSGIMCWQLLLAVMQMNVQVFMTSLLRLVAAYFPLINVLITLRSM